VTGKDLGAQIDQQKVRAQLKKWQECLLDLTKSNPLLGINRSRVSKLRIAAPEPASVFKALVIDETELKLPRAFRDSGAATVEGEKQREDSQIYRSEPGDLALDAPAAELARKLRRIYDNGHSSVEERGVTTLHVAFGTLNWSDGWMGDSMAPIWMVPVQLVSKGPNVALRLVKADEEMQLNPALELYLRERHKVTLPQLPEDLTAGSFADYLEKLRNTVKEQKWQVSAEAWLSTFSFESLAIYKDLEAMADVAVSNRVIAAFAKATAPSGGSETLKDDLDLLDTPSVVPVPILHADSSQLMALTCGASGAHVVVHGPPGTGKSQTISNLIADALGRNRTVLFVSSKMAALNVVHQRLTEKGLDRFCLEAHSTKAGKTKIIDELRKTLENDDESDGERFEEQLSGFLRVREDLNRYVQELHRSHSPLGKTLYQVIGYVAARGTAPEIRAPLPWPATAAINREDLYKCLDALSEIGAQTRIFDSRATHPWRGFASTIIAMAEREQIENDLETVLAAAREQDSLLPSLGALVADASDLSFDNLKALKDSFAAVSKIDRLPSEWHAQTSETINNKTRIFDTASKFLVEFEQHRAIYVAVFDIDVKKACNILEPAVSSFAAWYQRITPKYRHWQADVKRHANPTARITHSVAVRLLAVASRLLEVDSWLRKHETEMADEVSLQEVRNQAAIMHAAERYRAAAALRFALDATKRSPNEKCVLDQPLRKTLQQIATAAARKDTEIDHAMDRLDQWWPGGFVDGQLCREARICALIERASECKEAISLIQEWVSLQRVLKKCETLGLKPFLNGLGSTSGAIVRKAFERRFYMLWASEIIAHSETLSAFSGGQREELKERFKNLDLSLRHLMALRIYAAAGASARRLREARSSFEGSEVAVLRHELQKRKRIKPLRKLFAEIPRALQALKPCMLMSPISVSTYLKPGTATFDLVVFDEASQLPTAEAIASILRAKQVVVAGDRNQLPPTSFFRGTTEFDDDESDEEDIAEDPLESLLDDSVATVSVFREAYLKWHYRSKDERLIKFSNHYFYENRLVTFPSASTNAEDRGVRLEFLENGRWDRGRSRTNRVEARRVSELLLEHFTRSPHRSVGIVAMNNQQKEAIEDAVADAMQLHPDLLPLMDREKPEPFFVKSLENVQGDERDTMIISVGYGKDTTGHLSLNFGPLNSQGGWRRLNVLVTRAKWQTVLVTSMRSHELTGLNPNNRGPIALRNFIAYGERSCELPQPPAAPTGDETNDFEDAVATALRDRGFSVDEQVGASKFRIDLAVRDRREPSRYVLGIECDGATYHSTRTARDRDILRQQVLESMGWRIHRIWSTDWFHHREKTIDEAVNSIALAESRPVEETVQSVPPSFETEITESVAGPPKISRTHILLQRRFIAGEPYSRFSGRCHRDLLLESWRTTELASAIVSVVETEGPIHMELLANRLKEASGVSRAGSNVQSNIVKAIGLASRQDQIERRNQQEFLWKKNAALTTFRIAGDGFKRPIEWIPREEIALAVLFLVEDQFGMVRSQLGRAIGNLFGLERVSLETSQYVIETSEELVQAGKLRENNGQLSLP